MPSEGAMQTYPGMTYGGETKLKRVSPLAEYRNTKVKRPWVRAL